jgi:HSP20 family protein
METSMNLRSLTPSGSGGGRSVSPAVNPFGFLHREIDRLFEDFTRGLDVAGQAQVNLVPSIDVAETDKEIVITAEMPGLERKDVEISVEDDVLTIRGEKQVEKQQDDNNKNYHLSERSYGVFLRVLQLPAGIDPSKIQAAMSNGVLKITIPKPARSEAKKIEVKEAA